MTLRGATLRDDYSPDLEGKAVELVPERSELLVGTESGRP